MTRPRPLHICIVTCDIVGPVRNGGIGTAYYCLARLLASAGHRVTVLYASGRWCEVETIEHWVEHFQRFGIELVALPATEQVRGHWSITVAHDVYAWLKGRHFDVVHVHEWRGIGFYTALAKRQGLCLERSLLCVGAHSPTLWAREGMQELASADDLEVDHMERETVALADVLWSPSAHMVGWMRVEGWKLPSRTFVRPYVLLEHEHRPAASLPVQPARELVFFGRLETRKGVDVFCDALEQLIARRTVIPRVTFLGKRSTVGGRPSVEYLAERGRKWPFTWRVLDDLDRHAALEYLRRPDRLAVLPSKLDNLPYTVLECLQQQVAFVAAGTGGIPEMVHAGDRERVLFTRSPADLATRLQTALTDGIAPARPYHDIGRVNADWLTWHAAAERRRRRSPARSSSPPPLVSVCLTHHNRPALLGRALDSLRAQDYCNLEVILVDDGSEPEAVRALGALTADFRRRRWLLVKQENRYLGAARNRALQHVRGDFVLFMDDDNVAEPHEISTFVRAAERSKADVLTCFLQVFQGSDATSTKGSFGWPFLGGALVPGLRRNVFGDANAFFRRSVFERIGGFAEDVGFGCQDWELLARATLLGFRVMVVPEMLVRYRSSPDGMLHTTGQRDNLVRALRPYLDHLPSAYRGLVHLAHDRRTESASDRTPEPARLDHVKRAVVFGTGEAARLALRLANHCDWQVPYLVDNNPGMWARTAHGLEVKPPTALAARDHDLVIVASTAGKSAISKQLEDAGLREAEDFVHFQDPVVVSGLTVQLPALQA